MKAHQKTVGETDVWITPKYILEPLGLFDLDPASNDEMPFETALKKFTIEHDGLAQEWFGRVWLNPPFNRYLRPKFMEKMAIHNNGIMLIPAAMETIPFKKYVWGKASGVLALDHRPKFLRPDGLEADGNSGATICLIAYGQDNFQCLIDSGLGFPLTEVRKSA